MSQFVKALAAAELAPGQVREVTVAGRPLALFNVDGRFHALDNRCAHRGGPLGQGVLQGTLVVCPWHAWGFDVRSGENDQNADFRVPSYEVKLEGEDVLVRLDG
jgi:nitrite reductase (NADH) small subunit